MEPPTLDLCQFCEDLTGSQGGGDRTARRHRLPFHPTLQHVTDSGRQCRLCQEFASHWDVSPDEEDFAIMTSSASEASNLVRQKDMWQVELEVVAARKMPTGTLWTLCEAMVSCKRVARLTRHSFTLVTCEETGE